MTEKVNVTVRIVCKWITGDFVYATIQCGDMPEGIATFGWGRNEYPVAQIRPVGDTEYELVRFVKRGEKFI